MGLTVLSLFDGMSCGQLALQKLGVKVDTYYASEIKKHGIQVTQKNFPNTVQLGDVTKLHYENGKLYSEKGIFDVGTIDIVMGGSPCQNFSIACIPEKRKGLEGEKSSLFYHYLRLLKEINPTYFLLENVSSMEKESKKQLDTYMEVEGVEINTIHFLPHLRKRIYWTNLPIDVANLPVRPATHNLQSILEEGYTPREYSPCLLEGHSRPADDKLRVTRRHLEKAFIPIVYRSEAHYNELIDHYNQHYRGKSAKEVDAIRDQIDNSVYEGVRLYTHVEMERLQGVPEGYTSSVSLRHAASLLGDGWTVDVIAFILEPLKHVQAVAEREVG